MIQWIVDTWLWWIRPRALASRMVEHRDREFRIRKAVHGRGVQLEAIAVEGKQRQVVADRVTEASHAKDIEDIKLASRLAFEIVTEKLDYASHKLNTVESDLIDETQKNRELTGEIDVLKVEREGMVRVNEALISRFDAMTATNLRIRTDAENKEDYTKTAPA